MLYEVLLRQAYDNRNCLNRWNYESNSTPAAVSRSFALASAFGGIPDGVTGEFPADSIMAFIAQMQSEGVDYIELSVEALYAVEDFYSIPYPPTQGGTALGTPMSSFCAYALQSNRVRTDIRRGNKRFVGTSETHVGGAGIVEATMTPVLEDLAAAMSAELTYDDEGTPVVFSPVILSLEKHPPDADHEFDWYAKYPTLAEQEDHMAVGITWTYKPFITTQNSRKR